MIKGEYKNRNIAKRHHYYSTYVLDKIKIQSCEKKLCINSRLL